MTATETTMSVHTKRNTTFMKWWELAVSEFARLGLNEPTYGPAREAYGVGESPETWAAYVANS